MFVLDTHVVSELRKAKAGKANANVVAWANGVVPGALFLSAISIMELETGTLLIERRDTAAGAILRTWLDAYVLPAFAGRILAIDTTVAQLCAAMHVPDRRGERNALIAACALAHRFTVVTRNVSDFEGTGVQLLDPWKAASRPS